MPINSSMEKTFFEKLRVGQQVKKFPAFYGARKFVTVFTRAHLPYLPCV
jgi:hypothetical protein